MAERLQKGTWVRAWFALSAAAFVLLQVSLNENKVAVITAVINVLLALVLAFVLERKYSLLGRIFGIWSEKCAAVSSVIAVYATFEIAMGLRGHWIARVLDAGRSTGARLRGWLGGPGDETLSLFLHIWLAILSVAALFFVFTMIYAVLSRLSRYSVKEIWRGMEKTERCYYIIAIIAFFLLITFAYLQTRAFRAVSNAVYSMDSGSSSRQYMSVYFGNTQWAATVKRLFLTVLYFPMTLAAGAAERVLFFMPPSFIFPYVIQLCTVALMLTGGLLLSRMCELKGASKALFLLGYCSTYTFLVHSLSLEKYAVSTFCVILLVYVCVNGYRGRFFAGQAAAGAMTTNIVFFPYLSYDRDIKTWFFNMVRYALVFLAVCIFCGELNVLRDSAGGIFLNLSEYGGGGVSWSDKALQYLNFAGGAIIEPETVVGLRDGRKTMQFNWVHPVTVNWFGVLFIMLAVAGFAANREKRFARFAFAWMMYSVTIQFIVGWQASVNDMFQCSLYFGWAYFSLIFLLFERLLGGYKIVKYTVYSVAIAAMLAVNVPGIFDIIRFGAEYYPAG